MLQLKFTRNRCPKWVVKMAVGVDAKQDVEEFVLVYVPGYVQVVLVIVMENAGIVVQEPVQVVAVIVVAVGAVDAMESVKVDAKAVVVIPVEGIAVAAGMTDIFLN